MIKNYEIGDKIIKLDNNAGWTTVYRSQFGHDILPVLLPFAMGLKDLLAAAIDDEGTVEINAAKLLRDENGAVNDLLIHVSMFDSVEVQNIVWALNRWGDKTVDDPETWIRQFDPFPYDEIIFDLWEFILSGVMSSKNLERLKAMTTSLRPNLTIQNR